MNSTSTTVMASSVTVSITPGSVIVPVGQTQQFIAVVSGGTGSGNVNWTVSCSTAQCGKVSPQATSTFQPTIYTAPVSAPASKLTVTLKATDVSTGKFASVTITVPTTAVAVSPSSVSVPLGATQAFTASVSGGGGVTWSLVEELHACNNATTSCDTPTYSACSPGCGTVSPSTTASGVPTRYSAPMQFTPQGTPPCDVNIAACTIFVGLFLQANSQTDSTAFGQASITFTPIAVSLSATLATVKVNGTQPFVGTVTNDPTGSGLTWMLTQGTAICSPGCGTISPTTTASGAPATYTAPPSVPALAIVTVTATSVEDTSKTATAIVSTTNSSGVACGAGSGSESMLKGQYAFLLRGPSIARAGSFTADGTGKITAGEEDAQVFSTVQTDSMIDPTASYYAVAPDGRGCLALITGGDTAYLRFALGAIDPNDIATAGHIIEFDDPSGVASGAGIIRLQDATSFMPSHLSGNYAMGLIGTFFADAVAVGGTFTSDGNSTISSGTFDINSQATVQKSVTETPAGSFTCCSANGRGTLTLQINVPTSNTAPGPTTLCFYMISTSDIFLIAPGRGSGEAVGIPVGTTFSQASLHGASVIREEGELVDIATASADGAGVATINDNINSDGGFTTSSSSLNYMVALNGRVTMTGSSNPPVLYLFGQNNGFLVGTDPLLPVFGTIEPQAIGPFNNASLSGHYMFGAEDPFFLPGSPESGIVSLDGVGNAAGTSDISNSQGLTQNQSFSVPYSISPDGTGNFGSDTTAVVISGNKLIFMGRTRANATIIVVEK